MTYRQQEATHWKEKGGGGEGPVSWNNYSSLISFLFLKIISFFLSFFFFFFGGGISLGPHSQHMEVHSLGFESEL